MPTLTAPAPRVQSKPRTVRPAHGVARLTLTINGTPYALHPFAAEAPEVGRAYRLRKADGTVYDAAEMAGGAICSCPDFIFARDGRANGPCKHLAALAAVGLLALPTPAPARRTFGEGRHD